MPCRSTASGFPVCRCKEISPNATGKLTFSAVEEYRKQLEEEFSAKVREDLTKLGVDKDVEFRVVTNEKTGGVSVITTSEDKAKIEQYFKDEVRRANERMVSYKAVGQIKIRSEEFPKNTSKKIIRFAIDKSID